MKTEGEAEEDQLTGNVLKGASLLRASGGVMWHADHVELALVRLQRTRERRAALARSAKLGVLGAVGLGALLFGPSLVRRRADHAGVAARATAVAPVEASARVAAAPGAPEASPTVAATAPVLGGAVTTAARDLAAGAPVTDALAAEAPARAGHLLQQRVVPRRQVAAARWVALAGEKRFDEAYGLLQKVPLRELDDPDDLLLAADVARQAGRPAEAVPFLERVVKDHGHELRAQLAGFSLGKIYLDNLDRPALAARCFAAVRADAPNGGLAQDALAREVEAWSRAGDAARAKASALEYVRLYPTGRRVAAVRDFGGLE